MSAVNELVKDQETILAQKTKQQADPLAKNAEQTEPPSEPELGEAGSDQSTKRSRTAFETPNKSVADEGGKNSTNGEVSSNFFSSP
ncbi:hypothetical protein GWO43_22470, partial [candidate division KSB1 bacterium]|nr:hypothetical protein [candidate division KSB1 bacterium]NIR72711.1 hypothetical protein [candidate division KSB1 bacterium]NIS26796.1 hypothetical protein [candidate division KSB1 bacterium]NIT73590.1 hypothetical protein [candidate division KSB1 bacterium]NIU27466.1 hypothetical protein [candidate division KSB1 bacterium]